MKRLVLAIGLVFVASTASLDVRANPINCQSLKARQVPGSTHVQVSFANICRDKISLRSLTRDGTGLKTDWQPFDGFVTNMGSGLDSTDAKQMCDCDVSVGEHVYKLNFQASLDGEKYDETFNRTLDVLDPASMDTGPADDAGDVGEDVEDEPWNEPEPEEMQGLDCMAACRNGGPGTEAAAEAGDDSGCAVVSPGRGRSRSPLVLVLFGLAGLWGLTRQKRR